MLFDALTWSCAKFQNSLVVQNCIFLECKIDHENKIDVMLNMTYCNQATTCCVPKHSQVPT